MENDKEIKELIESTIKHIKIAINSHLPGEAKVYSEILVLLGQAQSQPFRFIPFNKSDFKSFEDKIYDKPFEKISHNKTNDV